MKSILRVFVLGVCLFTAFPVWAQKIQFWDQPRRGANFFNENETADRFREARSLGIEVVRLVFNKWPSAAPGAVKGDFLLGPKGKFQGLVPQDLVTLKRVLDDAHRAGVGVVLSHLSLPGLRWVQHNGGKPDHRLWKDFAYHRQAARFWQELARALNGHPAVVGYNLLNEPHPEKVPPAFGDWFGGDYPAWSRSVRGTPRDLNQFNRTLAQAIRRVDTDTPIVVDSGFYATPWAFKVLEPLSVSHVVYSLHMYEPYAFTSYRNGKEGAPMFRYPGSAPIGESQPAPVRPWNKKALSEFLLPVRQWQKRHGVSDRRIFVSEFGVFRKNPGAAQYLQDLLGIFEAQGWHWAFYAFREDTWAGMDYELGSVSLPAGQKYPLTQRKSHYHANPIFEALHQALAP